MNPRLQLHALYILSVLASAILLLIGYTLRMMASDAAGDGDVRAIDAGQITGLTLMFREVIGRIQSIWEHSERVGMTERLAESSPPEHPAPADAKAAAEDVAGAAAARADEISGQSEPEGVRR